MHLDAHGVADDQKNLDIFPPKMEQWLRFRESVGLEKTQRCHHKMALDLLGDAIETDVTKLTAGTNIESLRRLTLRLRQCVAGRRWCRATALVVIGVLRRMLRKRSLPTCFVSLEPRPKSWNPLLGKRFGRRPALDPARRRIEAWVELLGTRTNNRRADTQRNIICWILNKLIPGCGLSIDNWPEDPQLLRRSFAVERIEALVKSDPRKLRKLHWTELFVNQVLELGVQLPQLRTAPRVVSDVHGDEHRISAHDLETMYRRTKDDPELEMLLLTLLSTGMRIGGFAQIKVLDVADMVDGSWRVKKSGRTLDKGPTYFNFNIMPRVRELLTWWLNEARGPDPSEYVFPGRFGQCRHTAYFRERFKALCRELGLVDKQFHLHALRHCHAYMLLEAGNAPDVVSKLLNHSSVTTTEKYYLKETITEVTRRANIPWLGADERPAPVTSIPNFLAAPNSQLDRLKRFASQYKL